MKNPQATYLIALAAVFIIGAAFAIFAARVSPGTVIVTNPGNPGGSGHGSVWVRWDSTQANLHGTAKYRLKKVGGGNQPDEIIEYLAGQLPVGKYTITFLPCSVPGYKPPTTAKVIHVVDQKIALVTVKYRH